MLCDSPTKYMQNQQCVDFIASVPTVWDETVALDGKLGEYAVIARRSGDTWYIGAITNWDKRTIEIDLDKIGVKAESINAFVDGVNAGRYGGDYRVVNDIKELRGGKDDEDTRDNKITVKLASGGGAVIIL